MDSSEGTFLTYEALGNPLWHYGAAIVSVIAGYLLAKFGQMLLTAAQARHRNDGDTLLRVFYRSVSSGLVPVGVSIGLRFAVEFIDFPGRVEGVADTAAAVLIVMAFARLVGLLVAVPEFYLRRSAQSESSHFDDMLVPIIGRTLRALVYGVAILQVFQIVSGKDMTTILAGLGIASLAFGLAAQESIGNLFGSLFLYMNKPFEIGERCNIDGHDGVIKEVGLTCTRLERLDGHWVTIPNGQLYKQTIHNIGKRPYIRRILNVTITYDTPPDKIERAVDILRELMAVKEGDQESKKNEPINQGDFLPRVYFNEFNADSLNIICIYWFQPPAYWDYLEHSQWLNMRIIRAFADEGIDFAFPSQTVYLAGDDRRPLNLPGLADALGTTGIQRSG